jgi:hypothetical protein
MTMFFAALLVSSDLMQSSPAGCPPYQTEVRISEDIAAPRIDQTKSTSQLKMMKTDDAVTKDPKFMETTGLTDATVSVDAEIRTSSSGSENGPACIWPSVVSLKISTAPIIYIDGSHGQCRQSISLEHEMGHVAIDRHLIQRYIPIFHDRVTVMAEAVGSTFVASRDKLPTARARIEEKINAMIAVTFDAMSDERASAQQAHDSMEEYRRVSDACPPISVITPSGMPHPRS